MKKNSNVNVSINKNNEHPKISLEIIFVHRSFKIKWEFNTF